MAKVLVVDDDELSPIIKHAAQFACSIEGV